MRTLIIGAGEIGKSMRDAVSEAHETFLRDKEEVKVPFQPEVLLICYPYHEGFVETTKKYIAKYKPRLTIINSTVKPGTTRLCGDYVVHSPCHGKHPHLAEGIKTFVKYIGGVNVFATCLADKFFKMAGISTEIVSSPESSELSKVLCTTYYGWNIVFMKEVARLCHEMNIPFIEVYSRWNHYYNTGYTKLGAPFFTRPVLNPEDGAIGGHCVIPNCDLLPDFLTDTIKERNELYKKGFKHEKRKKH